ncbi:MAG: DUF1194 domain-containing protein [Phycisphaerales bacterium]|nr:DUF1194 domain-containing protein [Phycisphaerales bacterium]
MAVPVDTELQLLVDVSGSVNRAEYDLQLQGYVNAFRNSTVQTAITNGNHGAIAVQFVYWSSNRGGAAQRVMADWTLIDSVASANAFADTLSGLRRPFSGATPVGDAILFGLTQFQGDNGFEGTRLVMDVSGDGSKNYGSDTSDARDAALLVVDTINGLPILDAEANLAAWYTDNVIGGVDSFVRPAAGFSDFQASIEQKLIQEIAPPAVPEPITLASLGLCCLGAGGYLRRRSKE